MLEPLGLTSSSFPARSADLGPDAVTGYNANPDGTFTPVREVICTIPAIGGLWATAADTVRLGTGWATLLPAQLAREAVTPHTAADVLGVADGPRLAGVRPRRPRRARRGGPAGQHVPAAAHP